MSKGEPMSQTVREIAEKYANPALSGWHVLDDITPDEIKQLAAHVLASTEPLGDRLAQIAAHRVCCSEEHDPTSGKIHGYCVVCGIPWPCEYAVGPQNSKQLEIDAATKPLHIEIADLCAQLQTAQRQLNTPEIHDFAKGVVSEAQHQRARWGSDHDSGKLPEDWFWLLGYLAGKCLAAYKSGDHEKAMHHMISTAAAIANWHSSILGQTNMRPGLAEDKTNGIG